MLHWSITKDTQNISEGWVSKCQLPQSFFNNAQNILGDSSSNLKYIYIFYEGH